MARNRSMTKFTSIEAWVSFYKSNKHNDMHQYHEPKSATMIIIIKSHALEFWKEWMLKAVLIYENFRKVL